MQRNGQAICWDEHSHFSELEGDLGNHQWRFVLTPLLLSPPWINGSWLMEILSQMKTVAL